VLVITARFPARFWKGDQTRVFGQIKYLAPGHDITVFTPGKPPSDDDAHELARYADVRLEPVSPWRRAAAALQALVTGDPLQTGWMMPLSSWRKARGLAADHDVALVMTVRSLRGPLPVPLVLDHMDSFSYNMRNRASGPESLLKRLFARLEARRIKRLELSACPWLAYQVVTTTQVRELLPQGPRTEVIPAGWDGEPYEDPPGHERDIDVIFTGDMSYPPNTEAANWLAEEILPLVRARRPEVNAWLVGRHASEMPLPGVKRAGNVPDMVAYLRRAKVAIVPIRGAGSPFKSIEAAANGAALVAYPWTVECHGLPAVVADDAQAFADGVADLLEDEDRRRELVRDSAAVVREQTAEAQAGRLERVLLDAAGRRASPGIASACENLAS
jgi:polysaccharide biosynthesis protein PslH